MFWDTFLRAGKGKSRNDDDTRDQQLPVGELAARRRQSTEMNDSWFARAAAARAARAAEEKAAREKARKEGGK